MKLVALNNVSYDDIYINSVICKKFFVALYDAYFHLCCEIALDPIKDSSINHLIANYICSGLSGKRTLLLTENYLQCQKWRGVCAKRKKNAPGLRTSYSQLRQSPCAWHPVLNLSPLPLSHPYSTKLVFKRLICIHSRVCYCTYKHEHRLYVKCHTKALLRGNELGYYTSCLILLAYVLTYMCNLSHLLVISVHESLIFVV